MKNKILILGIFSIIMVGFAMIFSSIAEASPGGLDKNGGHRCKKSVSYCAKYGLRLNQYHCHRGYCKLQ